jgi:hypothetical protein
MTRRTSSGNARNGITCSQAFSHAWVITGNRAPHFSSNASSSALVGVLGGVDRLQIAGDLLALAGHVSQARANQTDDACLQSRLGEDRLDRLGEPGQPVDSMTSCGGRCPVVQGPLPASAGGGFAVA